MSSSRAVAANSPKRAPRARSGPPPDPRTATGADATPTAAEWPPAAPDGLAPAGVALWAETTSTWWLSPVGLRLLHEACRQLDMIESLQEHVNSRGVTVGGSRGQVRPNPSLTALMAARAQYAKLLAQLDLPDPVDPHKTSVRSLTSVQSQQAAEARHRPLRPVSRGGA